MKPLVVLCLCLLIVNCLLLADGLCACGTEGDRRYLGSMNSKDRLRERQTDRYRWEKGKERERDKSGFAEHKPSLRDEANFRLEAQRLRNAQTEEKPLSRAGFFTCSHIYTHRRAFML